MHIKRFEGPDMPSVLAQVRRELGEDALILSTRTLQQGRRAFGLMARSSVEVQAAIDDEVVVAEPARGRREGTSEAAVPKDVPISEELFTLVASLRDEVRALRAQPSAEEVLRREIRSLRGLLASGRLREDGPFAEMAAFGLDARHAERLEREWRANGAQESAEEESLAGNHLTTTPAAFLRTQIEAGLAPPRSDEGDRLRVLIGAAGVGKTTSLAKLAVRNEEGERDVALCSMDQYRIGATAQLREYADLLAVPFCEVSSDRDLPKLMERFRGQSILLDTTGRDPAALPSIETLSPLRARLGKGVQVDLVLDASTKRSVQRAQLERFSGLQPDRVLLTKTDECPSLSDLANLALDSDCPPIAWLGTGQRVPEDLEMPDANALVRSIVGRAA